MSDPDWVQELPDGAREQARRVRAGLVELGCDDPDGWARSEISEDIAQLARYRVLHQLWPSLIDCWRDGIVNHPAARRMIDAGADEADAVRLARAVAYETVFAMLYQLSDDGVAADHLPYAALVEIGPDHAPTGRGVDGLYESLLMLDPAGADGADLWQ